MQQEIERVELGVFKRGGLGPSKHKEAANGPEWHQIVTLKLFSFVNNMWFGSIFLLIGHMGTLNRLKQENLFCLSSLLIFSTDFLGRIFSNDLPCWSSIDAFTSKKYYFLLLRWKALKWDIQKTNESHVE